MANNNSLVSVIATFTEEGIIDPITISIPSGDTIHDLCETIASSYDLEVDFVTDNLVQWNTMYIGDAKPSFIESAVLTAEVEEGDTFMFDAAVAEAIAEYEEDEDEDDDYEDEDDDDADFEARQEPGKVMVTVFKQPVACDIIQGVTSIADVLSSDKVLQHAGVRLDSLRKGVITHNGKVMTDWNVCTAVKLYNRDTIEVSPDKAPSLGC